MEGNVNSDPIAWATDLEFDEETRVIHGSKKHKDRYELYTVPIYVTPFEWNGLNDKEYEELSKVAHVEVIAKIENMLRDRNS
jgi:hypothetical protein